MGKHMEVTKMTSVAQILGAAKQAEIKESFLVGREQFFQYLAHLIHESDFYHNDKTHWAFVKVVTFLEDGWTTQQHWTILAKGCLFTKAELGQAMNKLAGGARYDKRKASEIGAEWIGTGEWPTRADLGAFMFYVCVSEGESIETQLDRAIAATGEMPFTPILGLGPSD